VQLVYCAVCQLNVRAGEACTAIRKLYDTVSCARTVTLAGGASLCFVMFYVVCASNMVSAKVLETGGFRSPSVWETGGSMAVGGQTKLFYALRCLVLHQDPGVTLLGSARHRNKGVFGALAMRVFKGGSGATIRVRAVLLLMSSMMKMYGVLSSMAPG